MQRRYHVLAAVVLFAVVAIVPQQQTAAQSSGTVVDSEGVFVWGQSGAQLPQFTLEPPQEDVVVPVVARLEVTYTPEPQLPTAVAIQNQRQMIQQMQDSLVSGMQSGGLSYSNVKRYTRLPYLGMTISQADVNRMQNLPAVRNVVPDTLVTVQTALANPIVGADIAQTIGFDGSGYAVAVLDTGVDFAHPALENQLVAEACFSTDTGGQSVAGQGGTFSPVISACPSGETTEIAEGAAAPFSPGDGPDDCNFCGHGTHVAGIAGGNQQDVFQGVAPGAGIIGVNVFSIFTSELFCQLTAGEGAPCTLGFTSDQLRAFEYVLELSETVDVASVNLSLGGGLFSSVEQCDDADLSGYRVAVDALRAENIVVIAASGNDGSAFALSSPACLSNVISVGATSVAGSAPTITVTDGIASFSNSAAFLDFLAPGLVVESSEPVDIYIDRAGTSMASPYVAGAWAAMRQAYPDESVEQIQSRVADSGVLIQDPRNGVSKPRLQLDAALPEAIAPTITTQPADVTVTATQPATFTVGVAGDFTDVVWQRLVEDMWQDIPDTNALSFTLAVTQEEDNGTQFRAVINNDAASTTSTPATLTVNPLPLDCLVDVNDDTFVTPADAAFVANRLGQVDVALDFDESGVVDAADVQTVLDRIGNTCTL